MNAKKNNIWKYVLKKLNLINIKLINKKKIYKNRKINYYKIKLKKYNNL